MSGYVQLEVWLHEYKLEALSSVLEEQGTSTEKRIQEMVTDLYAELVPYEVQQEIRDRIDAERAAWEAEQEAARKYTAFRVRQGGMDECYQLDHSETFLDIAKFLRSYLRKDQASPTAALKEFLRDLKPVSAEQYDQLMALRMENPKKVTGVFDLDFDRQEVSVVDAADGWRSYSMKDVASAIYHDYRKNHLTAEQYEKRFAERLANRQIASAGHLSARDIQLSEEISEVDTLLNFYMETNFDVDAMFGTYVCTEENDDWLNVYANYDMETGQVCDELEVDLHRADGREESLEYRLNAAEKAILFRKMDAYCQQQTGQTLAEYSAQLMAEDMAPPTQPTM